MRRKSKWKKGRLGQSLRQGASLRLGASSLSSGSTMSARAPLSSVSFPNFLQWVAPGGFCHLRSGWDAVNATGAKGVWRAGEGRAESQAVVSEALRNNTLGGWKMLSARPPKKVHYGRDGGFAPHPRLPRLRE